MDIRTMTRTEIRDLVVNSDDYSFDGDQYTDLKVLCVSPFAEDEESPHDWREFQFIIPKRWLCEKLKEYNEIDDDWEVENWLRNIYTTDESENLFYEALEEQKVLMVELYDC